MLASQCPDINFGAPCANGFTPLTIVIADNRFDEALSLLDHGASPLFNGEDETYSPAYALQSKKELIKQQITKEPQETSELNGLSLDELYEKLERFSLTEQLSIVKDLYQCMTPRPDFLEMNYAMATVFESEKQPIVNRIALAKLDMIEEKMRNYN